MAKPEKVSESLRKEARDAAGGESGERIVLVDGANVAHAAGGKKPRLSAILNVREKLRQEGFRPIVLVDAALRHQIDDEERYEALVEDGTIRQAPAGTDADYFILAFARELDARVLSNDRFRERADAFPRVMKRIIRFMVVEGEVVLEKRNAPR